MARNKSPILTEAELRLMDLLWEKGSGTVQETVDAMPEELAYTTVLTTLQILERKGYIRHEKEGRAYRYFPVVKRGQERRRTLDYMLSRFFDDSPELLVNNLLESTDLDADALERMRARILRKMDSNDEDQRS